MIKIRYGLILLLLILIASSLHVSEPIKERNSTSNHKINSYSTHRSKNLAIYSDLNDSTRSKVRAMILAKKGIKPDDIVDEYGGVIEQTYEELNMIAAQFENTSIVKLQEDNRILHLEYDKVVELKPEQVIEWPNVHMQPLNTQRTDLTGKGIKVAVIDSGISSHEDLFITKGVSMVEYSNSYEDDNGHGTHIAGIIGARNNEVGIVGVAPECELFAVKVLDEEGFGFLSDVIAGIDWAIQNNVDIINLSLGSGSPSTLMEAMINRASSHNIIVVAAAGNSGTAEGIENNVNYPARYPSVIGVAAVDQHNKRAPFSSTGETVELAAPGVNILSSFLNNSYARMDGTSSASPFVAGIAALIKQSDPDISPSHLRSLLQRDSVDLGDPGRDSWYGYGLVQTPSPFYDIYDHWAKSDILSVYEKRWMIGSNKYFRPDNKLTRAQAAVIFVRILGLQENKAKAKQFTDVSIDHWAKREVDIVAQNEIMIGSNNSFSPENNLTREQMVVMLYRALKPEEEELINPFTDVSSLRWSYKEIVTMNRLGVIKGLNATTFAPANAITRGQMAVMLNRIAPYFK